MKHWRIAPVLLALLLFLTSCTAAPPQATSPSAAIPSATVAPDGAPALERAARALDGLIPAGMELVQQQQDDLLLRRLVPAEGSGALVLPELTLLDGEWTGTLTPDALRDGTFMDNAVLLSRAGQRVDLSRYGQPARKSDALSLLLGVMEQTGYEIDADRIASNVRSGLLRQAMEMDLEPYWGQDDANENEQLEQELTLYQFQSLVAATVRALESRVLLKAGRSATLQDAAELWPLITGMEAAPFDGSNGPMTRLDLALAFKQAYTQHYAVDRLPEGADPLAFSDVSEDIAGDIAFVSYYQLMGGYPDYSSFSPEQPVRIDLLPDLLNQFYLAYHDGPAALYPGFGEAASADAGTVYTEPATYQDMVARAARLAAHYGGLTAPDPSSAREVLNLPAYSIYVNQQDDSPYAAVNCMPAMVCMVLKWRDPGSTVTPDELRKKYPHVTEGWYMYMVHEQLEAYGVPYHTALPTRENLVSALDAGNVVMCQFSSWDLSSSGHCFVVVGYRRQGGALWFCVEDPEGLIPGKYGRPANDQAWLEAEEMLWSITRFVSDVTIVEPAENEDRQKQAA